MGRDWGLGEASKIFGLNIAKCYRPNKVDKQQMLSACKSNLVSRVHMGQSIAMTTRLYAKPAADGTDCYRSVEIYLQDNIWKCNDGPVKITEWVGSATLVLYIN